MARRRSLAEFHGESHIHFAAVRRDFGLRDPIVVLLETDHEGGIYNERTLPAQSRSGSGSTTRSTSSSACGGPGARVRRSGCCAARAAAPAIVAVALGFGVLVFSQVPANARLGMLVGVGLLSAAALTLAGLGALL